MTEATQAQQDVDFALYAPTSTEIDALVGRVDVYPIEEHTFKLSSTEFPVEDGSVLTDQAVNRRATLRIDGVTSDILPASGNTISADRAAETWNTIERLMQSRTVVTVTTALRVYRNMLIVGARARRDVNTGRALAFQLELAEVIFTATDLLVFDDEAVEEPATDRASTVDRGDVVAPTVAVPAGSMAEARRLMVESGAIIVPPGVPAADLESLIADPTKATNSHAAEVIRSLFPTDPADVDGIIRAQSIPVDPAAAQTFRTILGGQTVRMTIMYHPSVESWFASISDLEGSPIVSSMRLGAGGTPMRGLVLPDFVGELIVSGTDEPGRGSWQENSQLIYLAAEDDL